MIRRFLSILALAPALVSAQSDLHGPKSSTDAQTTAQSTWKIDPTHSELSFTIRHLVSKVRGQFDVWRGTIVANPDDWNAASVEVVAQTATIDTNNEARDDKTRGL
jgi:polyisoprenoid-binding protein YceI